MTILARWRSRSPAERRALVEAGIVLAGASSAVAFLPFRKVARLASRGVSRPPPPDPVATIATVAWAIRAAATRSPFRAVCIEQGVAAQIMLRRRGIASVLHYGAAIRPDAGLAAHVWVRYRTYDVIGCEQAAEFALLASFPAPATIPDRDAQTKTQG